MRVNLSIADELMEQVDAFCKKNGLRKGAFFAVAAADYMRAKELAPQIKAVFGDFLQASGDMVQGKISEGEYQDKTRISQQRIEELRKELQLDK